jgi:acetoin utilization protein AcuB
MEVNDPVSTIMSRTVVVANQFHNFSEVLELFSKHGMHHLPVVDGQEKIIGIISSNDLMKLFFNPKYREMKFNSDEIDKALNIPEIMTPNPIFVTSTETIKKAAKLFYDNKIQCLPVVDSGKLVGILTIKDLAQLVAYYG